MIWENWIKNLPGQTFKLWLQKALDLLRCKSITYNDNLHRFFLKPQINDWTTATTRFHFPFLFALVPNHLLLHQPHYSKPWFQNFLVKFQFLLAIFEQIDEKEANFSLKFNQNRIPIVFFIIYKRINEKCRKKVREFSGQMKKLSDKNCEWKGWDRIWRKHAGRQADDTWNTCVWLQCIYRQTTHTSEKVPLSTCSLLWKVNGHKYPSWSFLDLWRVTTHFGISSLHTEFHIYKINILSKWYIQ